MLPIPTAETVLSSSTPTANTIFSHFSQYGYMEIGVLIAVLTIIFVIGVFAGGFSKLLEHIGIYQTKNHIYFGKKDRDYAMNKWGDDL